MGVIDEEAGISDELEILSPLTKQGRLLPCFLGGFWT